jgi:SAM-dependent methyltransferase
MESDIVYHGGHNLDAMTAARNYNAFLVRLIARHMRADDRVIDFGAGLGVFAEAVRDRASEITAVEPDPDQRRHIESKGLKARPSLAGVGDGVVDFVYTLNVLEHIEDDAGALAEIFRVLSPGGRLLIYVPAFEALYSSMDRAVGHCRRYHMGPLKTLVEESGFVVTHAEFADSVGFAASLGYKLFGGEGGEVSAEAVRVYDRYVFPVSRLIDFAARHFAGKNIILLAEKPIAAAAPLAKAS